VLLLAVFASAGSLSGHVKTPGVSVIMLDDGKPHPTSMPQAKIDQRGMRFVPVLLVVPVGTTVEFTNSDAAAHNVYWPGVGGNKKLAHNLGTFPQGQSRSFKFDHPGTIPLLCNVHPEMSATLIVAPSPFFAQTDQMLGDYFISGVPDGTYKMTIWHAGKVGAPQTVEVKGDTKRDLP
jgi:plastocyanin